MINSELRATIFFGYKEKFEQQIKSVANYVTLTEMVVDFDVKRNSGDKYLVNLKILSFILTNMEVSMKVFYKIL